MIASLFLYKSEEDGHKLLGHVALQVELGKTIGDTHLIIEIGGGITWGGSQSPHDATDAPLGGRGCLKQVVHIPDRRGELCKFITVQL